MILTPKLGQTLLTHVIVSSRFRLLNVLLDVSSFTRQILCLKFVGGMWAVLWVKSRPSSSSNCWVMNHLKTFGPLEKCTHIPSGVILQTPKFLKDSDYWFRFTICYHGKVFKLTTAVVKQVDIISCLAVQIQGAFIELHLRQHTLLLLLMDRVLGG